MLKQLILKLIRFYQRWISLDQGALKGLGIRVCRHKPYCSEYMYQAIDRYGIFKGGLKGVQRLIRCNPFNKGGDDPVK